VHDKYEYFMERYNLGRLTRKCVFAIAVVSFVTMTTGLMLQLHLLSHEHEHSHEHENEHSHEHENSREHDADDCLFCQQLITQVKFYSEPQPILDNTFRFDYVLNNSPETFFVISQPKPFNPRPPPSVS
jgi:hypothetical protein